MFGILYFMLQFTLPFVTINTLQMTIALCCNDGLVQRSSLRAYNAIVAELRFESGDNHKQTPLAIIN